MSSPQSVAQAATVENLLRCWIRETGVPEPAGDALTLDLTASGVRLRAEIQHWSHVGMHRFGAVELDGAQADLDTVAGLIAREAAHRQGLPADDGSDLVTRALDSADRIAAHLTVRAPDDGSTSFLQAEQALTFGHPLHPTPKSRGALSVDEAAAYAPELRGSFQLHWFAADMSVVESDSALPEPAERVIRDLAQGVDMPENMVAVPAHPWQAKDLLSRPYISRLVSDGLLRDLGPGGDPWYPTSSLRTVYRSDAPVMLKLSLGLQITNSRRENLRKELHRGVEVTRLLEAGLQNAMHAAYPSFQIVRDPGWVSVGTDSGLDVVLRENPFAPDDDVVCIAGLVESRLKAVMREPELWLRRYIHHVIEPVLWLYATYGIGLEAHQQNTLVVLDSDGMPVGGRYRDNQGYYFAESSVDHLRTMLGEVGRRSETVVPGAVIDERLGYYVGINNLFGLIGACGAQGLAEEKVLLGIAREELERIRASVRNRLLDNLLDSPRLRCKANLLTRLHEMDELVGPVATQSVYVTIDNPLVVE